jgi:hypothetical protein
MALPYDPPQDADRETLVIKSHIPPILKASGGSDGDTEGGEGDVPDENDNAVIGDRSNEFYKSDPYTGPVDHSSDETIGDWARHYFET